MSDGVAHQCSRDPSFVHFRSGGNRPPTRGLGGRINGVIQRGMTGHGAISRMAPTMHGRAEEYPMATALRPASVPVHTSRAFVWKVAPVVTSTPDPAALRSADAPMRSASFAA